jgi:GNAT superfamily N-acetyltransferase
VFVDESCRGIGIGKMMMNALLAHPDLQTLRHWALATRDAHSLYARYGFIPVPDGRWMRKPMPDAGWQTPDHVQRG